MTFTQEQMKILSKWEYNFHCAVYADWSPNPGEANARLIHQIYKTATGDTRRVCYNCQHSLLSLMRDCGTLYLKQKEAEKAVKVASTDKVEDNIIKTVTVKTTAKKTTKKK
jgi:hypothetical protein